MLAALGGWLMNWACTAIARVWAITSQNWTMRCARLSSGAHLILTGEFAGLSNALSNVADEPDRGHYILAALCPSRSKTWKSRNLEMATCPSPRQCYSLPHGPISSRLLG